MGVVTTAFALAGGAATVSALRVRGIMVVNTSAIRTPLVRQASQLYLDMGDKLFFFLEKEVLAKIAPRR